MTEAETTEPSLRTPLIATLAYTATGTFVSPPTAWLTGLILLLAIGAYRLRPTNGALWIRVVFGLAGVLFAMSLNQARNASDIVQVIFVASSAVLVIGAWSELARRKQIAEAAAAEAATVAPPVAPGAEAPTPAAAKPNSSHALEIVAILFSTIWGLLGMLAVVVCIAGYIWGGTNSAHMHCAAHRFGSNSFLDTLACTVEH